MEGGSLFNPGFLGSSFLWFIGQVADDSTWRENQNPSKFEEVSEMPAWGYRYKVRIIGQHEQEESDVTAEQLPWAQVMYPVTAGTGHGGSYQTPAIKQGSFVFGFFLDGKDQQAPIIMGCLGNNAKTKLERRMGTEGSGGQNFTPVSFYSKMMKEEPAEQKHLKDADLSPKQAGNDAYSSPSKENVTKESSDANNLKTTADKKKDQVLEEKHALACPDPNNQSEVKNIQTVIEKISAKIEKFQQSLLDADLAAGLPIIENNKDIDQAIEEGAEEMAKYMKGIMGKVQQFTTKEFNEKLLPLENVTPPSHKLDVLDKKVKGLEKIACMFNKLAGIALIGLLAAALKNAFNRKKKKAEDAAANAAISEAGVAGVSTSAVIPSVPTLDTSGSNDVPPPSADGFYRPTPLCETEEIIGEVLGGTINTIMSGFDSAIGPVVDEIQNSLGGSSTETGSENIGTIDNAINENNVLASLSSGALILSITQTLADEAKIDPNSVGGANRYWSDGTWGSGLLSLIDSAGQNTPDNQQLIADALLLINDKSDPDGIAAGLALTSNILGVNENLLTGIGLVFGAIDIGDIPNLVSSSGSLAATNPRILSAIAGQGAAISGPLSGGLGLGALGGMNFDIATSLNFVNSITKIFDCDPKSECSPNDTFTMQNGGGSSDKPSTSSIANSAQNTANSVPDRKSYGTSVEKLSSSKKGVTIKKVFAKPKSRTKDLTNLVGYVKGQPYYGPFHSHTREDGSVVKMVGIAHTTTPHDVIFDTVKESLE